MPQKPGPWDVVKTEQIPPRRRDIFDQLAAEAKVKKGMPGKAPAGDIFDQLAAEARVRKTANGNSTPGDGWNVVSTQPIDKGDGWNVVSSSPIANGSKGDTHGVNISATPAPQENSFAEVKDVYHRFKSMLANSSVGHAVESNLPKVADTLGLHPTTAYGDEYNRQGQQLVSPEAAVLENADGRARQIVKGAMRGVGEMTSAPSLATGAAIAAAPELAAVKPVANRGLPDATVVPRLTNIMRRMSWQCPEPRVVALAVS